jgi:hypothetical protein
VGYFDEKERELLMPPDDSPFKVTGTAKMGYRRGHYKKVVGRADAQKNQIAEGVIERLIGEVAFKI